MARKPALSIEKLNDLGAEKLAQMVLAEAEQNAGFRRQVKAALAGKSGPEAIAKLIDRRISGLERAKSFIEWDKARAFRDDLRSLTDTITTELGPVATALALDRLLRFIATHERVFERFDDLLAMFRTSIIRRSTQLVIWRRLCRDQRLICCLTGSWPPLAKARMAIWPISLPP